MGKTVTLVTGASSGLGKILAMLLCGEGHIVYVIARRGNLLKQLKNECQKFSGKIMPISGDLSDMNFRTKLISTIIAKEKQIDFLFNNAAFGRSTQFEKQDSQEIQNMLNLNVVAVTHLTNLVLGQMKKQNHGHIIHTGSIVAITPLPYFTLYNTTKSAVYMFNRSLRYELKNTNVTSTIILPARMKTGFAKVAYDCYEENGRLICVDRFNKTAGDPTIVARNIIKKMHKGKEVITPTMRAKVLYFMRYFAWFIDLINKNVMGPKELKHIQMMKRK